MLTITFEASYHLDADPDDLQDELAEFEDSGESVGLRQALQNEIGQSGVEIIQIEGVET